MPPRVCAIPLLESVHPEAEQMRASAPRALWPGALLLALAVALCYANSLRVPFLLDDPLPGVRLDYRLRPLVAASFALNRALSGESTWSFHVFNALVHLGCGLLLLGVLRRTLERAAPALTARTRDGLAFVTTILWLCHPLQTAAVTYLSQRAETLAAFFYLATLYAFLRAASAARPLGWQALTLLALALGFASKETIATAPFCLLFFDALFLAAGPRDALRHRRGFYGALALVTLVLALVFVVPPLLAEKNAMGFKLQAFGPLEYARTQPGVILHYLRLVFWPWPLCFDYGWPIAQATSAWLPQTAVIAGLLVATVILYSSRSWVGLAGLFFFLVLAPTSSFVPIQDAAFEHRVYLPLAAILALAVVGSWWLVMRFARSSAGRLLPVLAGTATLVLAGLTFRRNQDYRSAVRLMQLTVECAPHHTRARINLATALLMEDRPQEAIPVLDEALRLDPRDGFIYLNLGMAYMALEQVDRAIPLLQRAVESIEGRAPLTATFHEELGRALFLKNDHAASAVQFEKALELDPRSAFLHCRLAHALGQLERSAEALQHFQESLRLDPELQEAHIQLAALLVELGRPGEALPHALQALQIPPNASAELSALGRTFRANGRLDDALIAFREAMRLEPARPEPYSELAEAVCEKADANLELRRDALLLARRARELKPTSTSDALVARAEALLVAAGGDPQAVAGAAFAVYDDRLARLQQNVERNPADAEAHAKLAQALAQARRVPEAIRRYEEALRLAPERQDAHINLAALLVEQGRQQEALEHSLKALEILPNSAEEQFNVGQALRALGRFDEAMAGFLEASRTAPDLPEPYAAYAKTVCMKPGATDDERREALRLASKAVELTNATRADLLEICAEVQAALGDYAAAARLVEQALALPGPSKNEVFAKRLRAQREDYLRRAGE